MKLKAKSKINSVAELALINTVIGLFLSFILYVSLPYVLNYPEHTTNNDFQIRMVGVTYNVQFCIILVLLAISVFTSFIVFYRKLNFPVKKNNYTENDYIKLRKKLFNYPYITLITLTIAPTVICAIFLILFKTNLELLLRICIVILSVSAVFAITSYMTNRQFFINKLIETSEFVKNSVSGLHLKIYKKLVLLTIPLFLYTSVILILMISSTMTTEKGNLLYSVYHQELINSFSDEEIYSLDEAKEVLNGLALNSSSDYAIMFSATDGSIYYTEGELNDFLIQYTLEFYDKTDGQAFEYYGQDTQASVIKINTPEGEYFVGIHFSVFSSSIFVPLLSIAIITFLFNLFYIYYIGKTISNDLNMVINGLSGILSSDNVIESDDLPITSNDEVGQLTVQFNDIQRLTKEHIKQIRDNQDMLMEKERLASLGQLIGGIAHNLKTPIMSISGAAEGLNDLIKEYEMSVGNPEVTVDDHHDIAKDMKDWTKKIKSYTEYMSDIITAVKGQAVTMSNEQEISFTIDELVKRVNILMRHELKNALITLNVKMNIDENTVLKGNINSLVQVINNMISNSIQAYNGAPNHEVDFILDKKENNIIISVQDFAGGLSKEVQEKLFKEMITTKGKNGSGLGLFMSYSTIRAHFNGNITFDTSENQGTTFHIILPN